MSFPNVDRSRVCRWSYRGNASDNSSDSVNPKSVREYQCHVSKRLIGNEYSVLFDFGDEMCFALRADIKLTFELGPAS